VCATKKVNPINEANPQIVCSVDQVCFRSVEWRVGCGPTHHHMRKSPSALEKLAAVVETFRWVALIQFAFFCELVKLG
jgi:hypothetical protein